MISSKLFSNNIVNFLNCGTKLITMNRLLFIIPVICCCILNAQEPVDSTVIQVPSEDFLNKLDSLGGMDSIASAQLQYNKGVELMEQKNYDMAITFFDTSILYNPAFALAYFNKGICQHKKGAFDLAKSNFNLSIEKDPGFHLAHYEMGLVYEEEGFVDMAIESYSNAIKINGKEAKYYYQRGVLVFQAADYEKAIQDFNKAISNKSNHA